MKRCILPPMCQSNCMLTNCDSSEKSIAEESLAMLKSLSCGINFVMPTTEISRILQLIIRFARNTFAYLYAYRNGRDIIGAHDWVKKHRVHRSHSKHMDASLDYSMEEVFDADLERLYYPLGRYLTANDKSNEELGELTDPPIITQRFVVVDDDAEDDDATAGDTQVYDSDLDELLSLDGENHIKEVEDDDIDLS